MRGRRILLSGTWGTGKSILLETYRDRIETTSEWGRALASEGLDWEVFVARMLTHCLDDHQRYGDFPGDVLFDRGVPDCWAYARWFGVDEGPFIEAARTRRYEDWVLYFPFWEEIYVNDRLRHASPELARQFDDLLAETYVQAGYDLIQVPRASVERRVEFVDSLLYESVV